MSCAAVVIGAGGGIGAAMAAALDEEGRHAVVHRLVRSELDITDEASIAAAAARVAGGPPVDLIFVATGLLHADDRGPERALAELDAGWLMRNYAVNAAGPALVAKHFLPLLVPKERSVFAVLSARVGSISDNKLGGWHAYRASKAALNMLVRTIAIEARRTYPRAIVAALHPGTVDTRLSKPFQKGFAHGQLFDPDRAALQLLDVIDGFGVKDSGNLIAWDGETIAP